MCIISNSNINAFKLGAKIQNCRLSHKLSQKQLSEQVEITEHYLSDIERGVRVPKLDTLVKILNELEMSADYALEDSLVVGYKVPATELQKTIDQLNSEQREIVYRYLNILIKSF